MAYCQDCGNEVQSGTAFCPECGAELNVATETQDDNPADTQAISSNDSQHTHPGENGFAVKHAVIVGLLGLIPAVILGIIAPGATGAAGFLIGIPLFAYLGYKKPTVKSAFSRQAFWGAVMLLISPLMMIIHTVVFIESEAGGAAEEAGGVIGGTILVILAFVVGLPLAGVFYLAHKKTKLPEKQSTGG